MKGNRSFWVRRKAPTVTNAEFVLRRGLEGAHIPFRSQERILSINGYTFTADFVVGENLDVVIECDGSSHFIGKRCYQKTAWRDHELNHTKGIRKVLHFRNDQIFKELSKVIKEIRETLKT